MPVHEELERDFAIAAPGAADDVSIQFGGRSTQAIILYAKTLFLPGQFKNRTDASIEDLYNRVEADISVNIANINASLLNFNSSLFFFIIIPFYW